MSKPEKLYLDNKPYFLWDYEKQTQMKHKVLFDYFDKWSDILGQYYKICFFDCNGGCGAYLYNGKIYFGSSVIIGAKVKDKKNIDVLGCENQKDIYENLCTVLKEENLNNYVKISNSNYENIVFGNKNNYFNLHPTLFFVDPFGYSFKMDVLIKMMSYKKSEIILNFMFDFVKRFIADSRYEHNFNEIFKNQEWKKAILLHDYEKELFLVDLLRMRIKELCNVKYVFAYRLSYPEKDATYYYLFHLTNNYKGCSIMKSSFAKFNFGKIEYLGYRGGHMSIFDLEDFKIFDTKQIFLEKFSKKTISFQDIVESVIDETSLLESEIRKTLHQMEIEKCVTIRRITSKKTGINRDDQITFL